ncbi:hypothetical protein EON79_21885 [bacterium]|nr:MAG: hypothetical protein EON79_21885 [bacterium]
MIELLVAAAILALCVVPITGTIAYIRTNAAEARVQAEVQNLTESNITSRLDGGKVLKLIQTVTPVVTTQTIGGGVVVTLNLTILPVSGYKNLFAIACTATYKAVSTASRTDSVTLTYYATTV